MKRFLIVIQIGLLAAMCPARSVAAVMVDAFSPQGTVKAVRQVTARFSKPVVRFGDPRLADPFSVDCPEKGRGRWADARNWVYDFEQDLPAGLQCRFTLRTDFLTVSGDTVSGTKQFEFSTGGPAIRASLPREGSESIDEDQAFILALDAPATDASVAANAYCVISGLAEKIPLQVLTGDERKQLLAQREQLGYEYFRILWKNGRQSIAQAKGHAVDVAEAKVTVARCARGLPPKTKVQLVWGKGVTTSSGIATTADQTLAFQTRAAFAINFSCERANAKAACLPMTAMTLSFTAPVTRALAEKLVLVGEGHRYSAKLEDGDTVESLSFAGPFPEKGTFKIELPADLIDDAGRHLDNAARFPLEVQTAEAPPLVKFGADFGILELSEGGVLPVSVRNVEPALMATKSTVAAVAIAGQSQKIDDDAQIARWLKRIEEANRSRGDWEGDDEHRTWIENTGADSVFGSADPTEAFTLPKPNGAQAFEVIGIPLKQAGFYVVELKSPKLGAALLGDNRIRYVATSALVTNMAVHFEWGRESSLAFVTTLDSASPVSGADIRVSDYCTGKELWNGRSDASGIARIEAGLPAAPSWNGGCYGTTGHPLMVSARANGDLSFTLSSWNRGISRGDFQLPGAYSDESPTVAHTVLDRALFRAGETVSMKHFLREHTGDGISLSRARPDKLLLRHQGSDQTYTLPLSWNSNGSAENTWEIPKDAKLGTYNISLVYDGMDHELASGTFRVEQYRVPSMRAILQGSKEPLVNATEAKVDLFVSYLSGGAAAFLPVKLRTQIQPKSVSFPGYEGFHFAGEAVKEGIQNGGGNGAFYDDAEDDAQGDDDATPSGGPAQLIPLALDGQGSARATIPKLAASAEPKELAAELEYQDANGETLSTSTRIPLWPSNVVLGIKPDGWVATKDDLRFKVLALNLHGQALAGQKVSVDGFLRITHSYRRRLVGGFYSYDNSVETKRIGELCDGRTDAHGLLICKVKTAESGQLVLQATSEDTKGNRALSSTEIWVAGGGDWWFEAGASDRMDVLPEQPSYESGQVARFQVRMPFREATALVTVEREGVIDSFVTQLSGRDPVVEVPIKDNYAPNIYVSVLAMRGRVSSWRTRLADLVHWLHLPLSLEGGSPTALVDLSKPAYRLGIGRINVGWDPHRLDVRVTPSSETYKVRDTAHVAIAVKPARGDSLPADAEVAIAAVDEGLLELLPNDSWKLLDAMMQPRGLEVSTSTAQMQVVGKRHYGRKSGAPGGGGGAGRGPARELFDTLLLWKGRVPLDAAGNASVDIPLNDSLTSFRIVAIASAGPQLFGTGAASIRTTQELQLVSGLPALVREGDHFNATVTVRNASQRAIRAVLSASFKGDGSTTTVNLAPQSLQIDAGSAQEASWPVDVPPGSGALAWDIAAREDKGAAADRLKLSVPVIAAYPVQVYQATLAQLEGSLQLPVERPNDAIVGRGGIRVDLRAHLGAGLDGIIDYMSAYSYICFEQRASVAIALGDENRWKQVMNLLPSQLDRDGLVKYFPSEGLPGSDTLTAYLLAVAQEAGWEIPEDSRTRMQTALKRFVAGAIVRDSALPTADLSIRKLAAIAALSRYDAASASMLTSLSIEPNLWPTSAVLDWIDILHRVSDVPDRDQRLAEALQILRSRLNFQGTTMGFSTEHDDALWWLMINADVNAVRAVLQVLQEPDWHEDMPRLVRGALGRQLHGRWNTTVANAWGVLAMKKFGAAFESEPVTGITRVSLGAQSNSIDWSRPVSALDLAWPEQAATLDLQHAGGGKPWAMVQSRAALPLRAPLFTGYTIQRAVMPIEQKKAGVWTRGDIARVHLDLEAQSDMTWVVVDDPVPAGASIQGSGLGGSSQLLTRGEQHTGTVWPAYEERRFDAFRSYFMLVPKGKWTVEYTVRFNASGRFELPATRVEAMYAPEMFGELPNAPLEIQAP